MERDEQVKYRNISMNCGLIAEIEEKYVGEGKRYRSIADFVSEAGRLRLEELEKDKMREEVMANFGCLPDLQCVVLKWIGKEPSQK